MVTNKKPQTNNGWGLKIDYGVNYYSEIILAIFSLHSL